MSRSMNDGNLYQAPAAVPPPLNAPQVSPHRPPILQVFGILHLLAAAYGLIMGVWGLFISRMGNPFDKMIPPGPGRDAQAEMMKAMEPMNYANTGITLTLMVLITIAGVKLLRGAKNSVKASNVYAVASLVGKIVSGALIFVYMIPAQRDFMDRQMAEAGEMPESAKTIMDAAMTGGAVIGVLLTCIYPILCLILLNRKSVKAWLEHFGK